MQTPQGFSCADGAVSMFEFFKQKNDKVKKRPIPGEEELPAKRAYDKGNASPMQIRHPRSFADVEEIIDRLRDGLTVIVYLHEVNAETSARVKDILSGAIYALNGGMAELQKDMLIFTPDGVDAR